MSRTNTIHFYRSSRDLVTDRAVHDRFKNIMADTLVAITRVSKDKHFIAYSVAGKDYVYKEVPNDVALILMNRLGMLEDPKPSNHLLKLIKDVVPFNPCKPATFVKYTKQGTFPDIRGIVRGEDGKERECIVVGNASPKVEGHIYLMLDQSIIFVAS